MSIQLTRRNFITATAMGALGSTRLAQFPSAAAAPAPAEDKPLYAFIFLGDLHYDRIGHHDLDWVRKEKPADLAQIEGYSRNTEQFTPRLLENARDKIKELRQQQIEVPFVIQIGDLVEGLCGSFERQCVQFNEAIAAVEKASLGAPCLLTKGNHDITGPGAREAFAKVLLPWVARQHEHELPKASYIRRQGEDLFAFFDAYEPDLDWLERTLKARENRSRQVFFVIHPPVVPYNARSDWHIFAQESARAKRARLLSLLGSYRVVVLSGHLHKYNLLTRRTAQGMFTQFAVSSVIRSERETAKDELEGISHYGPDLLSLEPKHSPQTQALRRELLKAEAPSIGRYEYADSAGYSVVKVHRDRVAVEIYAGVLQKVWKTRELGRVEEGVPGSKDGNAKG